MSIRLESAICVIGGGPAGAATARRLAQLGHSVVVVEKQVFPRAHVGESVSPGVLPLLGVLGIKERVEDQGFLRPQRVLISWPPNRGYKSLGPVPGFQVDRAKFDTIMLDSAREAGAHVLEGARLVSSERDIAGGWNLKISCRGKSVFVERCFVVDASGRRSIMGGKKRRNGASTLALWNYWRDHGVSGTETRVEAGEEQWYWGAPLPDGSFNATVFVDRESFQHDLQQLGNVDTVYQYLLARSELLAACLEGYPTGSASVCDATCYSDDEPVGPDLIKVGESLFYLDPLSSQGVQAAVGTALHASAVVNTLLRRSEDREIAEQFYRERQQEAVAFHRSTAAQLYRQVASEQPAQFWLDRARNQVTEVNREASAKSTRFRKPPRAKRKIRLAEESQILPVPCMDGDFIVERRALVQPGRVRPTVFLGDVAVAPLLDCLSTPLSVEETLKAWSQEMASHQMPAILNWFWENDVIIEVS